VKKNLILLSICVGLSIATYIFQEVGDINREKQEVERDQLFDVSLLGEIKEINTAKVKLVNNGTSYTIFNSQKNVDERKLQVFFDSIAGIRIQRIIEEEEIKEKNISTYFTTQGSSLERLTFKFEKSQIDFFLGRKLEFDQSFYMKIIHDGKTKYIIAYDSKALETAVEKETFHRNDMKYRRFQSIFYLNDDFFEDYRIFSKWMTSEWSFQSLKSKSKRNAAFKLNFTNGETSPMRPYYLSGNVARIKEFEQRLALMEGSLSLIRLTGNKKHKLTLDLVSTKGEIILDIYLDKNDYWLKTSLNEAFIKIKKEDALLLLGSVQQFWNLNVLKDDTKSVKVIFNNNSYITQNDDLLNFFKMKAKYSVSSEYLGPKYKTVMRIDFGHGPFDIIKGGNEILLVDKKNFQALVYNIKGVKLFPIKEEAYK
jgi:hypothetical protein